MSRNERVIAYGRELQQARDLDGRVALMARIASLRESIRLYQVTLVQLEAELQVKNEIYRNRTQTSLDLK